MLRTKDILDEKDPRVRMKNTDVTFPLCSVKRVEGAIEEISRSLISFSIPKRTLLISTGIIQSTGLLAEYVEMHFGNVNLLFRFVFVSNVLWVPQPHPI